MSRHAFAMPAASAAARVRASRRATAAAPGIRVPDAATTVAARRVGSSTRRSTVAVNCSLTSTSSPTTSSTTSASPAAGHEVVDDLAVHRRRPRGRPRRSWTRRRARAAAPPPRLHEDRGRQHAGQERPRRHHAAQLLQHHGELRQARALAAVLLGHVQPEPAEPGDLLPRGGHRLLGRVEQRPGRGALPGEERAGHLGQRAVVVGDRQGHGATTSRSRRGRASRRTRGRLRGRRPRS
jgi:hypothetical protein